MKKLLCIISMCILFSLIGCSKQPTIVGTWILNSMEENGKKITGDELHTLYGGEIKYQFDKNKVFIVEMMGQKEEGTWELKGNDVVIHYKEVESTLKLEKDKMILEQNGYLFTFEKQKKE